MGVVNWSIARQLTGIEEMQTVWNVCSVKRTGAIVKRKVFYCVFPVDFICYIFFWGLTVFYRRDIAVFTVGMR